MALREYLWEGHVIRVETNEPWELDGTAYAITCDTCSVPAKIEDLIRVMVKYNYRRISTDYQLIERTY